MDLRRLDDRRGGRDDPAEALRRRQLPRARRRPGSPQTTARIASRLARTSATSSAGASAARRRSSTSARRSRKSQLAAVTDDADVDLLAALDARDDAQDRVGEGRVSRGHRRSPSGSERGRARRSMRNEAKSPRRDVGLAPSHCAGTRAIASPTAATARLPRRSSASSIEPAAASRTCSASIGGGIGSCARQRQRPVGVLAKERRAVVDQPDLLVPDEQVGVAVRAVDVRDERVEPDDVGGERGVDRACPGVYGSEPGRKSIPRFRPGLASISSWISGSGSAAASAGSTSTTTSSGTGSPSARAELAGDDLGDERLLALPGAAELRDVHPVVVGLHEPGQRAALAQGLGVAGRGDGAQGVEHARSLSVAARAGVCELAPGAGRIAQHAGGRWRMTQIPRHRRRGHVVSRSAHRLGGGRAVARVQGADRGSAGASSCRPRSSFSPGTSGSSCWRATRRTSWRASVYEG